MIRSTRVTTKFSNTNKQQILSEFVEEYSKVTQSIIEHIWKNGYTNQNKAVFNSEKKQFNLESNLNNEFLKQFDNGRFTQRMLQACGTQASAIIRSCTVKSKQRNYIISSLMKIGKDASKLQSVTHKERITAPKFTSVEPQIDSRFFDTKETQSAFDGFIQLRLFKGCKPIKIPFKKHKHFLKLEEKGKILNSIRIGTDCVSFSFEIPDVKKRSDGVKVGADQGIATCLTLSDGQVTNCNSHGYDLNSILRILVRKKKGSNGFRKAQSHRKNYINWSLNSLNLNSVHTINLEKLFLIGKGSNQGRFLSSFTYPLIKKKLHSLSETEGFVLSEIGNVFRSQRCSKCGWTQKSSRKGKLFTCKSCGFSTDSDLNASLNLVEDQLPLVPKWVRERKLNRTGFFWNLSGLSDSSGEIIVPHVQNPIIERIYN